MPQYECGVLPPRLTVGRVAHISPDGFPNNLRSVPGESGQLIGEIPAGAEFTVVDGPRCASNISFWRVDYNEFQGWTAEGQDTEYFIIPGGLPEVIAVNDTPIAPPTPQATSIPTFQCNGVTSRLYVGLMAQVTPGLPNNMRAQPGESGQYLGEIPPGFPFEIVGGPECNGNILWWQVNYQGTIGWTGEAGSVEDYWLEPIGIGVETINPDTLIRLGQVALITPDVTGENRSIYINGRNDIIGTWLDGRQWTWNPDDPTLERPDTSWINPTLQELPEFPLATNLDVAGQVVTMIPSLIDSTQIQLTGGTYFDEFDLSRNNKAFNIGAIHPLDSDMLVVSQVGQGFIFVDSNPDSSTYRGVSQAARVLIPTEVYTKLEFSANGQRLVGLTDMNHLIVWTGTDANPATWSNSYPIILSGDVVVRDFSISPDGSNLLIAGQRDNSDTNTRQGFYSLFDLSINAAQEAGTAVFFNDNVDARAVAFSPDGSWFAVVRSNNDITFYDTATQTSFHEVTTNGQQIVEIVFNADATLMVTLSDTNQIGVWRIR